MAKKENTENKVIRNAGVSSNANGDSPKKPKFKYKYRKNNQKNKSNQSEPNVAKPAVKEAVDNSVQQVQNETNPKQQTNKNPNKRNYKNNRYFNKKKKYPNKAEDLEQSANEIIPETTEVEIEELRAFPEEPNVDMDFTFLEASREDIEDMIAEMEDEESDSKQKQHQEIPHKYKKEKIIIGDTSIGGSVLQSPFFLRVSTIKQTAKHSLDKEAKVIVKTEDAVADKNDRQQELKKNENVSAPKKTEKGINHKKQEEPKKSVVVPIKETGVAGSVLTRLFLEKYNLIKPIEIVAAKEDKPKDDKVKATKPKEERIIEPKVESAEIVEAEEEIVIEEPLREEDIYKIDKLSFDPKVQKNNYKIGFELIEPVKYISPRTALSERQLQEPAVKKVLDTVRKFLVEVLHIDHTYNILLAVSGGVDSVVLADAVTLLTAEFNYNIAIAHYNHNLRGTDSDEDEKFVKQLAEKYNSRIFTANGKVKAYSEKNSLSIEHAARILRYKFFERTSRNINADFVATAHMADDSAETLLLNLLRGSGLTGLSGIPKVRTFVKNVRLIRPLIELRKTDLIAYAKERRLIWREDKSNQLLDYTRNKVRHSLIPMLEQNFNPNIIDTLTRTAKLISGADEFVSDMVTNSLEYVTDDVRQERFAVKVNLMQTFPEFVQGEIIQKLVNKYFRIANLPMRKIADIIELMNHQTGAVYQINKNYQVLSDRKKLIFTKVEDYIKISERFSIEQGFENAEISLKVTPVRKKDIKFNDNPNEEYLDKSKISRTLKIRNKEEGDCFIPLGMLGRVKVSDFLTNEKVSLIDKSKVLVLESGGEIVWVVGHRVSEKFKVDAQTQEAYKIEFSIKNGHKNEQKTDGLE